MNQCRLLLTLPCPFFCRPTLPDPPQSCQSISGFLLCLPRPRPAPGESKLAQLVRARDLGRVRFRQKPRTQICMDLSYRDSQSRVLKYCSGNKSNNHVLLKENGYRYFYNYYLIDWCCIYYFVRNSLVALQEALCALHYPLLWILLSLPVPLLWILLTLPIPLLAFFGATLSCVNYVFYCCETAALAANECNDIRRCSWHILFCWRALDSFMLAQEI